MKIQVDYFSPKGVALMTRNVTQAMEINIKDFKDLTIKKKMKVGKLAQSLIETAIVLAPHVENAIDEHFAQKWLFDTVKLSYFMGLQEVKGNAIKLPFSLINDALIVAGKESENMIWNLLGNSSASEEQKKKKAADSVYTLKVFIKSNAHFFFDIVANYPNPEDLQEWLWVAYEGATRRAFASSNVNF